MNIKQMPLSSITPYDNNPRKNKDAVEFVKKSIQEFGFQQPVIVDKNNVIICGHTRYVAAQELKMDTIPVLVSDNLTDIQVKAFRLTDNKSQEFAEWDNDKLAVEIQELIAQQCDMNITGFSSGEISILLNLDEFVKDDADDDTPDMNNTTTIKNGDIFRLGSHILVCGDCVEYLSTDSFTKPEGIQDSFVALYTDPPYNVDFHSRSKAALRNDSYREKTGSQRLDHKNIVKKNKGLQYNDESRVEAIQDKKIKNDKMTTEEFEVFTRKWLTAVMHVMEPGAPFHIFGGYSNMENLAPWLADFPGLHYTKPLIWVKCSPLLVIHDYMANYELIFYGWKLGAKHHFNRSDNPVDVISVKKLPPAHRLHITQKPLELMATLITHTSSRDEWIIDPFGGGGTTLMAAEKMQRRCLTVEIEPLYVDVIVRRWEDYSGDKAQWLGNYLTPTCPNGLELPTVQ